MNAAHVHLLLNHVPVLGVLLGAIVLAVALSRRRAGLTRFALGLFVAMAVVTIPTYLSGEPAEEVIESAVADAEQWVEPHEEAALIAGTLTVLLGLLAAVALMRAGGSADIPRVLALATLVLALVASGALAWTADLGGQIRHTELRNQASGMPD